MRTDRLARLTRTIEHSVSLAAALVLLWMVTPEPVKTEIRSRLTMVRRELLRARRVHRERRTLESEAWHVGQIVRDYDRSRDAVSFANALRISLPHPGPGSSDLGETPDI